MIINAVAAFVVAVSAATSFTTPTPYADTYASEGLYTLATTGWADDYAAEQGGVSYDEIGGNPAEFVYAVDTPWQDLANDLLEDGEFLAPHFADVNGDIVIMVAPHLFVDGELMKGANENKDHFIVISDGEAKRFDYSNING